MGDEGKLYVPEELISVYREKVSGSSCKIVLIQVLAKEFLLFSDFVVKYDLSVKHIASSSASRSLDSTCFL